MAQKISEAQEVGKLTAKGIMVFEGKVESVEDISGEIFKSGFQCEVGVRVKVNVGYDTPTEMTIFSQFKKVNGEIKGYKGGGFSAISRFLARTLGNDAEVNDDFTLMPSVLQKIVGKKIFLLRYAAGTYSKPGTDEVKINWKTWDRVSRNNVEELTNEFLAEVEKGYPNDFTPDIKISDVKTDEAASFDPNKFANTQSEFDEEVKQNSI